MITKERSCKGKKQYLNFTHANNDAKSLRRKTGEIIAPYHCKYCGHFHTGHKHAIGD